MIKIFKTFGGYSEIDNLEEGCWINANNPTPDEVQKLIAEFNIPGDILQDILDVDERPRFEVDDDWTLVIMRIPVVSPNAGVPFYTIPLGIFISDKYILTLCSSENEILPSIQPKYNRENYQKINDAYNFILRLFLRSGSVYLKYLKQINQQTAAIEKDLEKSIKNEELNHLLKIEKSLVYFITSIKSNEIVLAKIRNAKLITTEINEDLLEDAIIENKQALDMAQIYSDIQSGMMDAYASFISNNLNQVMKQLTSISIILMIPTLVASIYGMNVPLPLGESEFALPIVMASAIGVAIIGVVLFRWKKWF